MLHYSLVLQIDKFPTGTTLRETQVVVVAVVVVYRSRQSYSYKPISYLLCVVSEASKSERRS